MRFELDSVPPMGLAEFQAFQRSWAAAFPDQRHPVTTSIDPATPARKCASGFSIVGSARDGRLVRAANHFDALGLLGQMQGDPGLRDSESPAATRHQ